MVCNMCKKPFAPGETVYLTSGGEVEFSFHIPCFKLTRQGSLGYAPDKVEVYRPSGVTAEEKAALLEWR